MQNILILPGYDDTHKNTNSFLYKCYADNCTEYVLDFPLELQNLDKDSAEDAYVHSYGFFIFIVGLQKGLFKNVKNLTVFDGWFPRDCKFMDEEFNIKLPVGLKMTFFFPTYGSRKDYPLESIVRQAMANDIATVAEAEAKVEASEADSARYKIAIVRGIGFGHNMLYDEFTEQNALDLIKNIDCRDTKYDRMRSDIIIRFPKSTLEYAMDNVGYALFGTIAHAFSKFPKNE